MVGGVVISDKCVNGVKIVDLKQHLNIVLDTHFVRVGRT